MAIPVDVLDLLAHDLLDALVDALDTPGASGSALSRYPRGCPPTPANRSSRGSNRSPQDPAGPAKVGRVVVPQVALRGAVVRCSSTAPTPDGLTLDGERSRQAVDVWAVWSRLTRQWSAGSLFPSVPSLGCQHVDWQPGVRTTSPQGGLVAVTVGCTLTIT
ncbi:MAG: hypothetical protein IPM45_18370 [Acidimicrobiales bacterium]|nr:hypothetical protein [Acidimicrobiales bacterium]